MIKRNEEYATNAKNRIIIKITINWTIPFEIDAAFT